MVSSGDTGRLLKRLPSFCLCAGCVLHKQIVGGVEIQDGLSLQNWKGKEYDLSFSLL